MTNGEKLKEIFPSIEIVAIVPNEIVATKKLDGDGEYTRHSFSYKWWNAEYKEPKPMVEIDLDYVIKQKYIEREVLDKIRAEVANYQKDAFYSDDIVMTKRMVLAIIDKYKVEKEEG